MYFTNQDILGLEKFYRRNLINSLSGFKSLMLCGTQNKEGQTNLSLISSVVHVGATPPYVGMIMRPPVVERHTFENIIETEVYTLNHVQEAYYQAAHQTTGRYDREQSEFDASGLSKWYQEGFAAPFVAEAAVKVGLKLVERYDIKVNGTVMLIGEVIALHLPDHCVGNDGFIDHHRAGTLTVGGLDAYHRSQKIERLSYAKPDRPITTLDSFHEPH